MKIKYFGTAAAEGIPGLFCDCDTCKKARELGGREIRTRSQALIDDKLLIDFPPDTYMHILNDGLDFSNINNILITHSHSDHLYLDDFAMRFPGFSQYSDENKVNIYTSATTAGKINAFLDGKSDYRTKVIEAFPIELYKEVEIGEHKVTPLEAVHGEHTNPYIYIIKNNENKTLLYAHDTDYFHENVWEYIDKTKQVFDFISLDCTNACMENVNYKGHMGLYANADVVNRLRDMGSVHDKTIVCCNHFSHNADKVLYKDFCIEAKKYGFETAYDGLEIEF